MTIRYLGVRWDVEISQECDQLNEDLGVTYEIMDGIIRKAQLGEVGSRVAKVLTWIIDPTQEKGCLKIDRKRTISLHFRDAYKYRFIPQYFLVIKYFGAPFKGVDFCCEGSATRLKDKIPVLHTKVNIKRCEVKEIDEHYATLACRENPGYIIHTIYKEPGTSDASEGV